MKKIIVVFALCFISFSGYSIGRKHNTFVTHKAILERGKAAKLGILPNLKPSELKSNNGEEKENTDGISKKLSLVQRAITLFYRYSNH